MDKRTFTDGLRALQRSVDTTANPGSFDTERCAGCAHCNFCSECTDCYRCNYAVGSEACTHCTHIRGCTRCHGSTHLVDCTDCADSQYLVMSTHCRECTYCFGCVGLVRKEFHILNEPYDRKTYFKIVKALTAELGLPR